MRKFLAERETLTDPGDLNNANAVLQISVAANPELYKELRRELPMSRDEALRYVFSDLYEEGEVKGKADVVTAMLRDSEPVSRIMKYTQLSLEKITEIARSIGVEPVI